MYDYNIRMALADRERTYKRGYTKLACEDSVRNVWSDFLTTT